MSGQCHNVDVYQAGSNDPGAHNRMNLMGGHVSVHLNYDVLEAACSPGGASVLTVVTELAPAAGPHAGVAPARYVSGDQATYAFETRFVGGEPVKVVLVDSKSSSLNRVEQAVTQAIMDGHAVLSLTPRMMVTYEDRAWSCLEAPHRFTDGHFRAGTVDGMPATDHPVYRAARDATPANARAVLELSPASLVLGAWDSTRRSNQARYRSALVGEVIGVLADQSDDGVRIPKRGGARRDEIAPSVRLNAQDMEELLKAQESELSPGNVEKIRKAIARAGRGTTSASPLGLGSIPPALETLGLVACRRIIRSHVLSFSALRQLRFGSPGDGDVACRALLAAWALCGLAHANQELLLRANCDLVEAQQPVVVLDGRNGTSVQIDGFDVENADELLEQAITRAVEAAGIRWEGQSFQITGNPLVHRGTVADDSGE